MSIIAWLVSGVVAGFIASKLDNRRGEGAVLDLVLGFAGALVGGLLFSFMTTAPVTGFNIHSLVVAVVGAIAVLAGYHAVTGHRTV